MVTNPTNPTTVLLLETIVSVLLLVERIQIFANENILEVQKRIEKLFAWLQIICQVHIFLYSVQIQENTDQKKVRIWTLFMQWDLSN